MKRTHVALFALLFICLYACKKNGEDVPDTPSPCTSVVASTTQAKVGQTVNFKLTSKNNTSNWLVLPNYKVIQAFRITTSKVNYITFNQPGVYRVRVLTKNLSCDSTRPSGLDSCWYYPRRGAHDTLGNCGGVYDTCGCNNAWISIVVRDK